MTPEQSLWNWLHTRLRAAGYFTARIETTTGRGFPDVFVARNGKSAFIELKALNARVYVRAEQAAWHAEAALRGGVTTFVINREPATKMVSVWRTPITYQEAKAGDDEVRATRRHDRRIASQPRFEGDMATFAEKLELILGF